MCQTEVGWWQVLHALPLTRAGSGLLADRLEFVASDYFDTAGVLQANNSLLAKPGHAPRYRLNRHPEIIADIRSRHRQIDNSHIALSTIKVNKEHRKFLEGALAANHEQMLLGPNHASQGERHQFAAVNFVSFCLDRRQSGWHDRLGVEAPTPPRLKTECFPLHMERDNLPAAVCKQTVDAHSPGLDPVQRSRLFALRINLTTGCMESDRARADNRHW
ncbi:hypothetical protein AGR2A_pa60068 [Agrobacterium genomosp. 2 str. CFBP 5494]|uniref:Uncharacterized protein n=1 Tax=Agrobacterium genomosp. 2 str. CFBP 5494 TaxID=1183436 RepID=A0A9W5B7H6_9HYPH|nr:hypothetical protein AGR2A_pa60068 [Agrobacterium genomosp. 2 str. CFBP 5494]